MTLRHYVGYYGGLVLGITLRVTYSTGSELDHYTYTFTVSGDATIAVTIGGSGEEKAIYFKNGSSWAKATKVYKKVNGAWVQQADLSTVFSTGVNYKRG